MQVYPPEAVIALGQRMGPTNVDRDAGDSWVSTVAGAAFLICSAIGSNAASVRAILSRHASLSCAGGSSVAGRTLGVARNFRACAPIDCGGAITRGARQRLPFSSKVGVDLFILKPFHYSYQRRADPKHASLD